MATFVLIPGGWHGGWYFQSLARQLRRAGHEAYPLTLTGLGERSHLLTSSVNLDTHIQDVIQVLESEQIENAVLCGHSYGGMVVSGAADRMPERMGTLVYCDAYVPEDGDSCWSLAGDAFRDLFIQEATVSGYVVTAPSRLDRRATAHPLGSFLQAIRLTGALNRIQRRHFVYLSGWDQTPFASVYERLRQDPTWSVHTLPVGHNVMSEAPDRLLEILLDAAT